MSGVQGELSTDDKHYKNIIVIGGGGQVLTPAVRPKWTSKWSMKI